MDLTKNFEALNFPFCDSMPGKVSTCKNVKIRKLKFKFLAFYVDFLKFLPSQPIVL